VATALLTLALAVPALVFACWPSLVRRRSQVGLPATPADDERAGLENEKVIALRALRELELDRAAGHVDDEDYRDLHSRYEGDAVAVLRQLDALGPAARPARGAASPAPGPGVATPWTRQPVALGAMGVALLVFGVVLGLLVSRYSTPAPPEPDMAAGQSTMPSAMAPGSPGAAGGAPRPLPKEMLEGMLQAAHASLDAGRYQEAIAAYTAILKRDQRNVDAITHLGVILALAGHHAEALEAFDRALAIDPHYAHALWDKAGVQEARQDHAGAVATLERFVRVAPAGPDRDRAQERLREAKARLAAAPKAGAPVSRP
jgi:tetratricopeptide (TPR) repeat protein